MGAAEGPSDQSCVLIAEGTGITLNVLSSIYLQVVRQMIHDKTIVGDVPAAALANFERVRF